MNNIESIYLEHYFGHELLWITFPGTFCLGCSHSESYFVPMFRRNDSTKDMIEHMLNIEPHNRFVFSFAHDAVCMLSITSENFVCCVRMLGTNDLFDFIPNFVICEPILLGMFTLPNNVNIPNSIGSHITKLYTAGTQL